MSIVKHIDFEVPNWGELGQGPASHPSYPALVQADGPIAYWQCNEVSGTVAVDTMGSHDGSITNNPSLNQPGPISRHDAGAVQFAGVGIAQNIVVASHSDFDVQLGMIVECWAKLQNSGSTFPRLVARGNGSGVGFHLLCGRDTTTAALRAHFNGGAINSGKGPLNVAYDQWHHVMAGVISDGSTVLCVNAASVSGAGGGTIISSSSDVLLGGAGSFHGHLAQVAIYQKGSALTAQQVQDMATSHYNAGIGRLTRP